MHSPRSTACTACTPQHALPSMHSNALHSMHRLFDSLVQSHRRLMRRSSLSACSRQLAQAVRHSWLRHTSQLRQPILSCSTRLLASMYRQQSCRMSLCNSRSPLGDSGEPATAFFPPHTLPLLPSDTLVASRLGRKLCQRTPLVEFTGLQCC